MSYSTPALVRQALVPSLADPSNPPPTPTNTAADLTNDQIQDAINEADSTIDGMIGRFYAVPVASVAGGEEGGLVVPHPIDYWSRNLAAYNATLSYRGSMDFTDDDPVARRYNATMTALNAVQAGNAQLQLPDNVSLNAATGASAPYNPYSGDLFSVGDFDLRGNDFDTVYGPQPFWPGGYLP